MTPFPAQITRADKLGPGNFYPNLNCTLNRNLQFTGLERRLLQLGQTLKHFNQSNFLPHPTGPSNTRHKEFIFYFNKFYSEARKSLSNVNDIAEIE